MYIICVTILSDRDIKARLKKGDLVVEPLENMDTQIGPASLDLRLGDRIRVFKYSDHSLIDPQNFDDKLKYETVTKQGVKVFQHEYTDLYEGSKPFIIHPHDFILGSTLEKIRIPYDIGAKLEGRSSLGRFGLMVHSTAGWIDPGFEGHITLEITNIGKVPVKVYPGMRVAQLVFEMLSSPSEIPYDKRKQSKYRREKGATESRIGQDAEFVNGKMAVKE